MNCYSPFRVGAGVSAGLSGRLVPFARSCYCLVCYDALSKKEKSNQFNRDNDRIGRLPQRSCYHTPIWKQIFQSHHRRHDRLQCEILPMATTRWSPDRSKSREPDPRFRRPNKSFRLAPPTSVKPSADSETDRPKEADGPLDLSMSDPSWIQRCSRLTPSGQRCKLKDTHVARCRSLHHPPASYSAKMESVCSEK